MPWLLITAVGGIGAWLGSLTGTAVANSTQPQSLPSPPYGQMLLYGAGAIALVYGAKKVLKM